MYGMSCPHTSLSQIEQRKLSWKADSKVGSLEKVASPHSFLYCSSPFPPSFPYCPCSSFLPQASHRPGGGDIRIQTRKLAWKAESKVATIIGVKNRMFQWGDCPPQWLPLLSALTASDRTLMALVESISHYLHHSAMHTFAPLCTVRHCTSLHYSNLPYTALHCNAL